MPEDKAKEMLVVSLSEYYRAPEWDLDEGALRLMGGGRDGATIGLYPYDENGEPSGLPSRIFTIIVKEL